MRHFEYVHKFLKELEKHAPTNGEIRHNITLCKGSGKLQISIFINNEWCVVDMDSCYEDTVNYKELARGITEMLYNKSK